MAVYTMRDLNFTCEEWQKISGQCPITTGEQVLDLYKLNVNPELNLMALGVCAIVYRFLAYVVLKVVKERWLSRTWKKFAGRNKKSEETSQVSTGATKNAVLTEGEGAHK
jgi:hypothetical protein